MILSYELPFALDLKDCIDPEDEGNEFIISLDSIPAALQIKRFYKEPSLENRGPFPKMNN